MCRYNILSPVLLKRERKETVEPKEAAHLVFEKINMESSKYRFGHSKVFRTDFMGNHLDVLMEKASSVV